MIEDRPKMTSLLAMALGLGLVVGCGPTQGPGGRSGTNSGTSAGGSTPGSRPSSSPPAPVDPGSQLTPPSSPPNLSGPGTSPGSSPTFPLPAPRGNEDLVAEIRSRWGIEVGGTGVDSETLRTLREGLEDFQPGQLTRLTRVDIPKVYGAQSLLGTWQSNGLTARITLYAQTGRPEPVSLHTTTHELSHHVSLFTRRAWGDQLDAALGQLPQSFPSSYSRSQTSEKLAENMTFALIGDRTDQPPLRGWRLTTRARSLLESEFPGKLEG